MRIVILVHNLTGGGAERVAALWATGFEKRGYEVGLVLNCSCNTSISYTVPDKVRVYNIFGNSLVSRLTDKLFVKLNLNVCYIRRLKKIFQHFRPDIAIGVMQPWAEWARKASLGLDTVIINTEHNTFERPSDALYNPMTKKLYWQKYEQNKHYNHVTVLTEVDRKCVDGILNNVSVLPNPLAFKLPPIIPPKDNVILAAGRLDAWHVKGFDLLINAWGKICHKYPDWKLQIAGDGAIGGGFIQTLADEALIGKQFELLGFIDEMLPIYQRASIFVFPSRYDGFGMVLIEAMSQGCAPITCDYKGRQREIINSDEIGIVCPVDDVQSLVEAISLLIDDDKYRVQLQKNSIERSKFYSLENTMDRWEEIFNKVVK